MADIYRETRVYRDDGSDDDDRYKSTTVRRYKVNTGRYDRSVVEVDEDPRSRYSAYSGRPSGELLEVDRRSAVPDRPRSAFEPHGGRSLYYERDEYPREDRSRISVYEGRETDRDWDKRSRHSHHHHHHRHDSDEIRVEKRVEERFEDPHGVEVERYRKETEYYTQADPPPAPVIIRQRAPEPQKIIVQEAPPPAPIIVPRQDPGIVVVRDKEHSREMVRREPSEEEYWYRHERREVGSHRGDHDREYGAVGRYDPRRRDSRDEDYYVRRTVVRRERSESPHHKRYLAEGALAAAGITALLSARRDKDGELQENRGRKVIAGAALGALGTEAVRRAHSAYGDRWRDGSESPDRHSMLKKGLGVAAVALAAAGAAKYYQTNKIEKEETHRGRSRRRSKYSGDEYSRSPVRSRSRRRSLSTVAKAALGTAATAGIVKHLRDRSKSKGRSRHSSSSRSRSRSKSRLRRGAEIAGAAAAAGVATKMWKNHKDKKDARDYSSDEDDHRRRRYSHSRSRSRSRSQARSLRTDSAADPELGLVEYGNDPLPVNNTRSGQGYESEAEERRERRRRRRDRDRSSSPSDTERKRSKSRLRDMAAAGAAAIGIKTAKDRYDQDKRERRAAEDDAARDRGSRERRSRSRDHHRGRYDEDEEERDRFYTDHHRDRAHSPPTASGGAYFPPYPDNTPPPGPPPMGGGASLNTFPDPGMNANYQPYVPQDYTGYAPPGPPPPPAANTAPGAGFPPPPGAGFPPPPPGPPPPAGGRVPPDHVSDIPRHHRDLAGGRVDDGVKSPPPPRARSSSFASSSRERLPTSRSVTFIPLSPKSSMTMERHKREQAAAKEAEHERAVEDESDGEHPLTSRPPILRRRSSDPSSDRSIVNRRSARDHNPGVSDSEGEVELLPARFDDYGRPLDGHEPSGRPRWTSRRGEFERRPTHPGDWNVRGAWQVGGTEDVAVERLARTMTDVLDGRQSWLQLIGGVIGGGLLQPEQSSHGGRHDRAHSRIEDGEGDDDDSRQAKYRKRR